MTTRLQDPPNLTQALELEAAGIWAHAIHEKGDQRPDGTNRSGKRPIGEAWGVVRWDPRRLREAFKDYPRAGVGVALGPGGDPAGNGSETWKATGRKPGSLSRNYLAGR
jgi:hypothetical protein